MRFLMLVCTDTEPVAAPTSPPRDIEEWVDENDSRGTRIVGERLVPEGQARTVRVRGGKRVVTDGPFLETKEVLGGFDLLECRDLDEAIAIAADHPMASYGVIELRALMD